MTYPTTPFNGAPSPQNGGGEQIQATPTPTHGTAGAAKPSRLLSLDLLSGISVVRGLPTRSWHVRRSRLWADHPCALAGLLLLGHHHALIYVHVGNYHSLLHGQVSAW